jgi:hypothetical protein
MNDASRDRGDRAYGPRNVQPSPASHRINRRYATWIFVTHRIPWVKTHGYHQPAAPRRRQVLRRTSPRNISTHKIAFIVGAALVRLKCDKDFPLWARFNG